MLIDTHTHLYLDVFDTDRQEVMARAEKAGVESFYLPNIDSDSIEAMLALEKACAGRCFPMMGLHPCSVKDNFESELRIVKSWLDKRTFIAVGEIGIDLHWDKTYLEQQKEAFLTQVEWAIEKELPIVIHSREAIDLIIELLQPIRDERLRGVFHCFTGNIDQAQKIMELGFFLGIGGVLTFKNSGLDATLEHVPMDYIVLETDAPYLAPAPYRGKRNESSYIKIVAERLAAVKNILLSEVATVTTANAHKLFSE